MEDLNLNQDSTVVIEADGSFVNDLFDGDVEIPTTTETEQEKPIEQTEVVEEKGETDVPQDSNDEQVQSPFMTVKYNKESRNLTQEEAIEYAQKGMNYDSIYERYTTLKDNEIPMKELSNLAKANNMSLGDYVNQLKDVQKNFELDKELEALKEQYPNSDENLLKEVAESHITDRATMLSKKQQESENAAKQEIGRQLDVFNRRYPNVDASKLDPNVYSLMKDGFTLLEAYESINNDKRIEELEKQKSLEEAQKLNQENKKKSLGNTSTTGDAKETDDLINILFSD